MRNNTSHKWPEGVAVTLDELMRYQYYVQEIPILPQHPVYSILAGRHASRLRGRGLDFEEVRVYVPGDDVRNIDWRVTARTGTTHTKVFNEEKERPSFLVVDQSSQLFFGSQEQVKSVIAAQVAALSAFYTIRRGDRVGGIVYNEDGFEFIHPARSKTHVQYLLKSIAEKNALLPARKPAAVNISLLNDMLKRTAASVTHDYVIAVISDFTAADDTTVKLLRGLALHNDVMLVHISDPLDAALPDGRLILGDGKKQLRWKNSLHNAGQKYEEAYKKMQLRLAEEFRNYRIPVIFMDTTQPASSQVIGFFSNRNK
ncbi:Protein of unknown function DUF58 [Chitinophaga jiangningensis]|uniref:DUF58 domain-containing protein n=1 Tax=Chitinophaga jiangningensis TaxID=1419482 RepID=A0A1M7LMS0_9BACT|nr:DUF58 domain-containing protein [Chitinophaga jiangningensis]SHM79431.1 Protein of unknown function DUF58 [Chitinophaga jiangningensis]